MTYSQKQKEMKQTLEKKFNEVKLNKYKHWVVYLKCDFVDNDWENINPKLDDLEKEIKAIVPEIIEIYKGTFHKSKNNKGIVYSFKEA